jgi:hypothetical protein
MTGKFKNFLRPAVHADKKRIPVYLRIRVKTFPSGVPSIHTDADVAFRLLQQASEKEYTGLTYFLA